MKYFLLPFLMLLSISAFTQQQDKIDITELDSLEIAQKLDSLTLLSKADSIQRKIDSLQIELNKLTAFDPTVAINDSLANLEGRANKLVSQINNLQEKANSFSLESLQKSAADSLGIDKIKAKLPALPTSKLQNDLANIKDSLIQKFDPSVKVANWQNKLDSAQQSIVDTVSTRVKRKFSKLKAKQDSLSNLTGKPQEMIAEKQQALESKIEQINNLPNDKLNDITAQNPLNDLDLDKKLPTNDLGLPGINNPNLSTEGLNLDLPTADLAPLKLDGIGIEGLDDLSGELKLPTSEIPGIEGGLENAIPKLDLNEKIKDLTDFDLKDKIENPLDGVKSKLDNPIEDFKNKSEVEDIKGTMADVKEISAEANEISEDIKAAQQGDYQGLEDKIVDKADIVEEMDYLQKQRAEMESMQLTYEEKLKIMREIQDKEVFKKKLETMLKEELPNHFAGKEQKILEAQKVLFAYKKKYAEVSSIRKLNTGEAKVAKSERFFDRVFIGADMEIVRGDDKFFDVSPYLGYEITRRWQFKLGYSWRMGVKVKDGFEMKTLGTRGFRTSVSYLVFKGFQAVAGYERTSVNTPDIGQSEINNKPSHIGIAGIRKTYKIFRGLSGDAQILYNKSLSGENPFQKRLNLRFGIYWDMKSGKKKH